MGRRRRPYLPGGIFHLTARTIRYERWLTPALRTHALGVVADTVPRSRARLLAAAIMPNHLHLVVQQGERPLAALMQPLLRRLALGIHHAHGLEGPVFWRHYGAQHCYDPHHARNAIVYTHLNPVRAGLCGDPGDYPWTSHRLYDGAWADPPPELLRLAPILDPSLALPLFAAGGDISAERLRAGYQAFVQWRLSLGPDAAGDAAGGEAAANDGGPAGGVRGVAAVDGGAGSLVPDRPPPMRSAARAHPGWGASLSPLFHSPVRRGENGGADGAACGAPDMITVARLALSAEDAAMTLVELRGRGGGREAARLRHVIIRRLNAAGFSNVRIAQLLDLSESAVSHAVCRPR